MTVPVQTPLAIYTGNDIATVYPYHFKVARATDLAVIVDGTAKVLGVDYAITGVGEDTGGDVTFTVPPADGVKVILRRVMQYRRDTNFVNLGDLLASTLNKDQDDPVMMIQQLAASVMHLIIDASGDFVWDAEGHRITHVGDAEVDTDAVNQRVLLKAIGDFTQLGLNVAPKMWEFTGDGEVREFYLPGADVSEPTFYDVYVDGVAIEPGDGFTVTVEANAANSHLNLAVPPDDGAEGWVVLRGYAKPVGFDLINNPLFVDLVKQIIQDFFDQTVTRVGALQSLLPTSNENSSVTLDASKMSYLLRCVAATPTTLTIRANDGDPDRDWPDDAATSPYFSVLQRGDGEVTVTGAPGVSILVPEGYLAKPRTKGSTITLTGDNVAAGQWVCSGDMALATT